MRSDFISLNGTVKLFDLDNVCEVVRGHSEKHNGWTSLVIYEPTHDAFIELRSSPPDIRGNSKDEAEEIKTTDITNFYGLSESEIVSVRSASTEWRLIDRR